MFESVEGQMRGQRSLAILLAHLVRTFGSVELKR